MMEAERTYETPVVRRCTIKPRVLDTVLCTNELKYDDYVETSVSIDQTTRRKPNFMVLLRIPEVPGSNLGPVTGYPDRFFVVFSVPPGKYLDRILN
jgi:hypothetical protein